MARKTIKLPEEDYERHNEKRKAMGQTWAEYIDGESPELESMIRRVVREELDQYEYEYVCKECGHVKYSAGPLNHGDDVGDMIECPECGAESFEVEGKVL